MARILKATRQRDRIEASLIVHGDIMQSYITEGWSEDEASKTACRDVVDMPNRNMVQRANELRNCKPLI